MSRGFLQTVDLNHKLTGKVYNIELPYKQVYFNISVNIHAIKAANNG